MFDTYTEIFNQRGQAYHQAMLDYPDARRAEFQAAVELLQPKRGQTIGDVPSGGGYLRRYLSSDIQIVCVETSIEFLRRSAAQPECSSILCADLVDVPIADGTVDSVLSLAGSHHLSNRLGFLRETFRILKPGGRFVLADAFVDTPVAGFLNGFVDQHSSMGHRGIFLNRETPSELSALGFQIESAELLHYPWNFADEAAMVRGCTLMFGMDRASPQQVRHGLNACLGVTSGPAGVRLNWQLYFISSRKP